MKIKPKQTRICGWCGKEFTVNVYNKTYCSNKCANAFRNSQTETRVCIVCGEKFETLSRNTAVRCMDCRSKKPKKKKCTFTPTNDNTPDGPNELDMWMGDRGLVPVRVETGRQKAKATVKIRPEKLRKPLLEPTKQWTGETPEERFWRSAAEAMQKYRMKAPAERKRRDTCPKGRYTETEDAIIVNMRKKGVKIAQIAAATGRSVPAIKQRLMACKECYKFKRCFERRGVCSEYRSVRGIREAIKNVNDDWIRVFGRGNICAVGGVAGAVRSEHGTAGAEQRAGETRAASEKREDV